ncbi:hypothetical protein ZHAS_00016427 [Anopheles sinensis]|uniref:Uncharacterized protein n=1 Tax=Anopheles sinensis TaxID=74873 RepID=A0A084WE02_ANOSI|nr:hypothetical protein ZHAS_00016427 [Anopheles sinensis]
MGPAWIIACCDGLLDHRITLVIKACSSSPPISLGPTRSAHQVQVALRLRLMTYPGNGPADSQARKAVISIIINQPRMRIFETKFPHTPIHKSTRSQEAVFFTVLEVFVPPSPPPEQGAVDDDDDDDDENTTDSSITITVAR